MKRILLLAGAFVLMLAVLSEGVSADTAILPAHDLVRQQAILGWRDGEELLILTSSYWRSYGVRGVVLLPLPSIPSYYGLGSTIVFSRMYRLAENVGIFDQESYPMILGLEGGAVFIEEVVLGPHHIGVYEVEDPQEFAGWIREFLAQRNESTRLLNEKAVAEVVGNYTRRGYRYLLIDWIESTARGVTIEPLVLRFESPHIYYPLRISQLDRGATDALIYVVTPKPIDMASVYERLEIVGVAGVSRSDVRSVCVRLAEFFRSDSLYLTVLRFYGSLEELDGDLEARLSATDYVMALRRAIYGILIGAPAAVLAVLGAILAVDRYRSQTQLQG